MAVDAKRFPDLKRIAQSKATEIPDEEFFRLGITYARNIYDRVENLGKEELLRREFPEPLRTDYSLGEDGRNLWFLSRPAAGDQQYDGYTHKGLRLVRLMGPEGGEIYIAVRLKTLLVPYLPPELSDDDINKRKKLDLLELSGDYGMDVINATATGLQTATEIESSVYWSIDAMANDCKVLRPDHLTALGITVVNGNDN